jgi:hypothetical protein
MTSTPGGSAKCSRTGRPPPASQDVARLGACCPRTPRGGLALRVARDSRPPLSAQPGPALAAALRAVGTHMTAPGASPGDAVSSSAPIRLICALISSGAAYVRSGGGGSAPLQSGRAGMNKGPTMFGREPSSTRRAAARRPGRSGPVLASWRSPGRFCCQLGRVGRGHGSRELPPSQHHRPGPCIRPGFSGSRAWSTPDTRDCRNNLAYWTKEADPEAN